MKRTDCTDPFLRGYLTAALWTTDPTPGQGDYVESGRADEMFPSLPDDFIAKAKEDCANFEAANSVLLENAGDFEQNGHDFWLSRNHHGIGFWDRDHEGDTSRHLHRAAATYGEHDLILDSVEEA